MGVCIPESVIFMKNPTVDFILYGPDGFWAIEVKAAKSVRKNDLRALRLFQTEYPEAKCTVIYGGGLEYIDAGIHIFPVKQALKNLPELLMSYKTFS